MESPAALKSESWRHTTLWIALCHREYGVARNALTALATSICGSYGLDLNIILSRILSASLSLTRCSTKLLLGWEGSSYSLCRRIRYSYVYIAHMSPTLSGSLALYHIKLGDALELCNGIIFDFYSGLPHLSMQRCLVVTFGEVLHKHCLPWGYASQILREAHSSKSWPYAENWAKSRDRRSFVSGCSSRVIHNAKCLPCAQHIITYVARLDMYLCILRHDICAETLRLHLAYWNELDISH